MLTKKYRFYSLGAGIVEAAVFPLLLLGCVIIRLRAILKGKDTNPVLFMGTMDINSWGYVAKALRKKGYRVNLIVWNVPSYETEGREALYDIILNQRYPSFFKSKITEYFIQFVLFLWAAWNHDIIITCFLGRLLDRTAFLRWVEFPFLRLAGKKIVLNTYGADVMTPRMTLGERYRYSVAQGYLRDSKYASLNEVKIKRNRDYCQKWADCIISAIDHVEYLERVDETFHMRCIDIDAVTPVFKNPNAIPVIVHAPNHRLLKGTEYLIKAVDELNRDGFPCVLRIVEKCPHKEVLKELLDADIAADQFLVGAYARFAIEAMALCKPVLCYLREDLFKYNPIWRECPIINVDPDNLKEGLKRLISMSPEEREDIGRQGRAYIRKYHSIEYIGDRMDKIIKRVYGQ